jgi:hypothetical protein
MINKFKDWLFENSNEADKATNDFDVFVENFEGQTVEEEWKEYKNTIGEELDEMYPVIGKKLKDTLDNIYSFDPDLEPLFISIDNSPASQEMVKKYSIFAGLFAPEGDYKGKKLWGSTADSWLIYAETFDSHQLGKIKLPYCVFMEDRGMTRVYISRRDFINTFGSIEEFLVKKRGIIQGKKFGL